MRPTDDSSNRFQLLRGGPPDGAPEREVASYTNRLGVTYYLHRARTDDGHELYVARRDVQAGAVATMPTAYEFSESLSGRVSVRRVRGSRSRVPLEDVALVRAVLKWHLRMDAHIAERRTDSILIHEPDPHAYEAARRKAQRDPGYSVAAHLGPTPAVRPAMMFRLDPAGSPIGCRRYEAHGPTNPIELTWGVLERGRLAELAVRHLPRLRS